VGKKQTRKPKIRKQQKQTKTKTKNKTPTKKLGKSRF